MTRDAPNISTEYQPKGSGRNVSDTLDRPDTALDKGAAKIDGSAKRPGTPPVVDEKGRPLSGDGTINRT